MVTNTLAKQDARETVSDFLTRTANRARINAMMDAKTGNHFITSIVAAVNQNLDLQDCDNLSIMSAAMQGQALKLSPSPVLGHFYMVPFKNKKKGCKEASFVLGYKGYIQLAIRSGNYKKINVLEIKEGELIKWDQLTEDIEIDLIKDESIREHSETAGYYAMFEYLNGFRKAMYWTREKMEIHADRYSGAFNLSIYKKLMAGEPVQDEWKYSSFWYKSFDDMAKKTMIRQLISKWGILSIDMQNAIDADSEIEQEDEPRPEPVNVTDKENNPFA